MRDESSRDWNLRLFGRMAAIGLVTTLLITVGFFLSYFFKSELGIDLMEGDSPVHQFLDNIRQAIGF